MLRFRLPESDEEATQRFVLVEDRGDRLLVADVSLLDWPIVPTHVYAKNALVEIGE